MGVNGLFAMAVVLGTIGPALSPSQKKIQTLKCPLSAQSKAVGNKNKRDFSSEIVTLEDLGLDLKRDFFFFYSMPKAKVKFSSKGRKKTHRVPSQSHKGTKMQQYPEEKWEKAFELRARNANLQPTEKKWTLDRISESTGIPKSTLGHRFKGEQTGKRKGKGHIAGGRRTGRVLDKGKQAR